MSNIIDGKAGTRVLISGNEAIARGAIEAGISVAAAYPGTPATEILEHLVKAADTHHMYAEWSANEKVAAEVCAAASYAGLRSLTAMKHCGMNVASDALLHVATAGTRGGMVIVPCDDPGGQASSTEMESRYYAQLCEIPLLEPSDHQEAKDMVKYAAELSEDIRNPVMLRGVTRLCHASGTVELGAPLKLNRKAEFKFNGPRNDPDEGMIVAIPAVSKHQGQQEKLKKAISQFEESPFNKYIGPDKPELLIITSSVCFVYCNEAIQRLDLKNRVGVLKLGTTWPLPPKLLEKHLQMSSKILVVEEVVALMENNIKALAMDLADKIGIKKFHGKADGSLPSTGELNVDLIVGALSGILKVELQLSAASYEKQAHAIVQNEVPSRGLNFCAGCPHRASFWTVRSVLQQDNQGGFVCGDVGCYFMDANPCGFQSTKVALHMGAGISLASGFSKLDMFGLNQPILATTGDSTFFHSVLPGLANVVHNEANLTLLVLDNSGTAMTGFQPHPGLPLEKSSNPATAVDIAAICRAFGAHVVIADPFNPEQTQNTIFECLEKRDGLNVVILKQACVYSPEKKNRKMFDVSVNESLCLGEDCGCNLLCSRVFRCPALSFDESKGKACIDVSMCSGCGFCTNVCPRHAIEKKEVA